MNEAENFSWKLKGVYSLHAMEEPPTSVCVKFFLLVAATAFFTTLTDARVQLLNSKADQSYGDYTINPLSPTPLPSHDKFPPICTNTPPSTAQSPSPGPNPPHYGPSPPKHVPGPPQYTPSPPIYQPPVVNPSPSVPPPSPHKKPKSAVWCVAKPTVPDPIIQEAVDYACWSGADCKSIQPNGPCFQPNTLFAHASFAFNSYWQNTKVSGGTCNFGGTAMLVTVDPSSDDCNFIYN